MLFVAILVTTLGVLLFEEDNRLTGNIVKQLLGTSVLVLAGILFSAEYGVLRGVFILIGLISLIGTLVAIYQLKLSKQVS